MLTRNQIVLITSVAAVAVGAGVWWKSSGTPPPRPASVEAVMPAVLAEAIAGKKQKAAQIAAATPAKDTAQEDVVFERNGANILQIKVNNASKRPLAVSLAAGTVFESEGARVMLLKSFAANVPAGAKLSENLAVVALSSSTQRGSGKFTNTSKNEPRLATLLQHLGAHSAVPVSVAQTAVLAILEDAPAGLFARFPRPLAGDVSATETFRVETHDIVAAIQLLRDIGVDFSRLSQDAQLKVEATIDLQAHDIAMQYYGITRDVEWNYWTHDVLEGDPTMRHYALYGIARFFPDVALQMMPKWAEEARIAPHFRRAAIGALALTQKSEARTLLQTLERNLAKENALAEKIDPALRYLEQNLPSAL